MNRLARLNCTYQSLRTTIRQEQIQLTHLRKRGSKLFIRRRPITTVAKNVPCNVIKPVWPKVPMAGALSLSRRKLHIRRFPGNALPSELHLQPGVSFSRISSRFFGPCTTNPGNLSLPITVNQAIQSFSRAPIFESA
jgi:hypothetical protein